MPEDARRALLGALIDYAGLFPPAQLSMDEAVGAYRAARQGPHGWMLDRFVCPASRVDELRHVVGRDSEPWRVTVVVDGADLGDAAGLRDVLARVRNALGESLRLAALEVRLPADAARLPEAQASMAALSEMAGGAGVAGPVRCFVEVALGEGLDHSLEALSEEGLAAKVRCGGPTADHVPSAGALAAFVAACTSRALDWKATAGLHHPVRHVDAQTGGPQHGFLNLLVASGLAATGADEAEVAAALGDQDASAFTFDAAGLRWREHVVGEAARARFDGYGSCSFSEPVEDLAAMGVLNREGAGRA